MSGYIANSEIDGKISAKLLTVLNRFIGALRSVFHVHCMTKGVHSKKSYHYLGMACDGHKGKFKADRKPTDEDIIFLANNLQRLINKPDKTIFEQAIIAKLSGFNGIGMYPHWKPVGGLHTDLRPFTNAITWIGLNKKKTMDLIFDKNELQELVSDKKQLQKLLDKFEGEQVYIYLI